MNSCCFVGNIVRQPEIKTFQSGDKVANFSIAVDASYKDRDGNNVERAYFPRCAVYGKLADYVGSLEKGTLVSVVGEYTQKPYEKDGVKREASEFRILHFRTLRRKRDDNSSDYGNRGNGGGNQQYNERDYAPNNAPEVEDDLPF